ncbi:hypothetical protein HYW36_00445 [Candidatus Saccharibacteria bacterium]|nr:hypothetical protein [Candidatus Saccharibacteria bacterium]
MTNEVAVDFDKELSVISETDGPRAVAALMVDYYRQHGKVYSEALRRLAAAVDEHEIKALLRDVGLPDAMMAHALLRAQEGSDEYARRIIARVSRAFGEQCLRHLDDKYGVTAQLNG